MARLITNQFVDDRSFRESRTAEDDQRVPDRADDDDDAIKEGDDGALRVVVKLEQTVITNGSSNGQRSDVVHFDEWQFLVEEKFDIDCKIRAS